MGQTGAVAVTDGLRAVGATHVFGNPGTTELPFVDAVVESDLTYVTCLHEDVAMGAAAGFATRARQLADATGGQPPVAVANVHATPGVAHALGNLYGATFARAPVLLTAGCQPPRHERRQPPLSGDRIALVEDHVKDARAVHDPDELPGAVTSAARRALSPPTGPVYLEFSLEAQHAETDVPAEPLGAIPSVGVPPDDEIAAVAEIAAGHEDPTIVVGDDLARAGRSAIRRATTLAERLGALVYAEPLNGELSFPTDHPHWVGMLPLEPEGIREALAGDAVLFLGCTHPEPLLDYAPPLWQPEATAIWIGAHPEAVPRDSRFDYVLAGELEGTIDRLLPAIQPTVAADGAGVAEARQAHLETLTTASDDQRQAELDAKIEVAQGIARAATDAVIVDEGVTTGFLLRDMTSLPIGRFIAQSSGGLGYGLPAAVGAAIAESTYADCPRPTVALIGDGTYQYYPQALYTAAKHVTTPLTVVIPDNGGYGILRDRGVIDEDGGEEQPLTFDPGLDLAQNASSYGVRTRSLSEPAGVDRAVRDAIERGGTEVIVVDLRDPDPA